MKIAIELENFNGKSFEFAENFTCQIDEGIVWIEEYSEGAFPLSHIKKVNQFIQLYEILTGIKFDLNNFFNKEELKKFKQIKKTKQNGEI